MSSITRNRVAFRRQGALFTAANTTYPVDLVTDPNIKNVAAAVNSNANGVKMPEGYCNQEVVARVTVYADNAPTVAVAVYGYVRKVIEPDDTITLMDYTGSSVSEIPWDHLMNLNGGATITVATNACGGVNVIDTSANSFTYNEVFSVGGMYERIRLIPVVLTGTNVGCYIDLAFGGGLR